MKSVAFLKGMNLGNRRLPMSRLVTLFEALGLKDVGTFIASGNVLFETLKGSASDLEKRIETHLKKELGYEVDTFIRTEDEVKAVLATKAFKDQDDEGITVHVAFMKSALPAATAKALGAIKSPTDAFFVKGREFYWRCVGRSSDSVIWARPELKALKLPVCTQRSRTSLQKLVLTKLTTGP